MRTVVSFHAHPDDEALLTGGTLARLTSEGHRVVIVTATSGAAGLSDLGPGAELARTRVAELERSAAILGCARVVCLQYPDSGWSPTEYAPIEGSFSSVPIDLAAVRLAGILREEKADILTTYDAYGGYGHLDHIRVHQVGAAAAALAGTPVVLQATVDRTMIQRGLRILTWLHLVPSGTATDRVDSWFSSRAEITHKVSVRRYARQKKAALAIHRSQSTGGEGPRTARILLALPLPVFALVCGTEWFIESGAVPPESPIRDPVATVGSAVNA
jgi:LmbE family N-acetylglucosaminyl deacetylase